MLNFPTTTALRATIIEGKGDCNASKLGEFQHIMRSLWEELSDLADFDKVCIEISEAFSTPPGKLIGFSPN